MPQPPKRSHGRLGAVLLLIVAAGAACVMDRVNQDAAGAPSSSYSDTR